jgi:hypothetical protein
MSKCEISLEKGWDFECLQRMLKDFVNLKCEILDFQQKMRSVLAKKGETSHVCKSEIFYWYTYIDHL